VIRGSALMHTGVRHRAECCSARLRALRHG